MKGKELKKSIKSIWNLFQKRKEKKRKEKKRNKKNIRVKKLPTNNLKALSTLLLAFSNLFV